MPSARRKNTRQSFSSLPSVKPKTLGKVCKLCRVSSPHSVKLLKFAECKTKTLGKGCKVCRVSKPKHPITFLKFAESQDQSTRQSLHTLPSVTSNTLGKQECNGQILWSLCRVSIRIHSAKTKHSAKMIPRITEIGLFAECFGLTLGNASLCRVLHSAKRPIPPFLLICPV